MNRAKISGCRCVLKWRFADCRFTSQKISALQANFFYRFQVCRLRSKDSRGNTMGIIVPYDCAQDLSYELGRDAITVENVAISDDVASSSGMVKIEPKSEVKPEIKVEPKSEVKLEIKVEPKTEPNFE